MDEEGNVIEEAREDAISTFFDDIDDLLGLGLGRSVLWLIVMVLVAYGLWTSGNNKDVRTTFGIIGIVETFLLLIGLTLGFIGFGTIITVIIVALGILAFRFRQEVMGA